MAQFKFIDLFAGIGGFHLAFHALGGKCVFASEIDIHARKTYQHNFYSLNPELFEHGMFNDDIRTISPDEIPDFDILCAGFPCQPFSQAGYKRGFNDNHKSERGNLFFNIVDILEIKKPKAFFLENVRGLISHDKGKTFKIIRQILEEELNYSFYYQIVKASDYGLPQLRPRTFIIGFRDEGFLKGFNFPPTKPLKFNMSDVWGGKCSREIGFTLRVGGRGSNINDRRNWDSYLVDGQIKQLMPEQGKKMQGFPDSFEFPVSKKEAMKQLGNSVAVDAIRECGKSLLDHLKVIALQNLYMKKTKNKGEWTEIYSFFKIINDKQINLSDKDLNDTQNYFSVSKVSTLNLDQDIILTDTDSVFIENKITKEKRQVNIKELINKDILQNLSHQIQQNKGTFEIDDMIAIQNKLGISIIKGGTSNQKADIVLDIRKKNFYKINEGFGIKSYLGNKPTLLNASGNTNFIFKVNNLSTESLDSINDINSLKSRISKIIELGGNFCFHRVEKETMAYNLKIIDSMMPEIIAQMLLEFFVGRNNMLSKNLASIYHKKLCENISDDLPVLAIKVKRFLVGILLGFFAGTKWDGKYLSNGTIIVKEDGEQVAFHIIDLHSLEDYLFQNIVFDTPSTTRHRYGKLFLENDGNLYFKLNLQLRFR
ncbi:HpaII family restriction endonuclease [Cyanobacterium stanieri LEGE 03274]|uniref:Cytosine-specific methyltransferase n=1 Tax=Cyanobacterium stanieri LEGE 03274 TaxID=1828756 RepID=A0ABR9V018_9CHRO|nr:HpaII family restriction endonuclease [Cyanobacterium stanieri]MBE9221232.1 HpaII family restriction endonuclease [Cyanobacterium stanieri LEGE 03274]